MFLVLIEDIDTKKWAIAYCNGLSFRVPFSTREEAEGIAMKLAEKRPNRFAVVEIKSWLQQEVPPVRIVETRIG